MPKQCSDVTTSFVLVTRSKMEGREEVGRRGRKGKEKKKKDGMING